MAIKIENLFKDNQYACRYLISTGEGRQLLEILIGMKAVHANYNYSSSYGNF